MITVSTIKDNEYGKCCQITNGRVELLITMDFGPRVISFKAKDGENIMYEDKQDLINKGGEYFDSNLPNKGIWHIYGGHRLWKSPEYMDTYYPDNAPVKTKLLPNGASFVGEIEETTHLRKTMTITMTDDGEVTVEHKFTNCGDTTTPPVSLWGLSVLEKGAKAIIPTSTKDMGLLPNRNFSLWSYTDLKDPRLTIAQDYVGLNFAKDGKPTKIGVFSEAPIRVTVKNMLFTIATDIVEGATYPDNNCNVESYTNAIMLEIETLSPLYSIAVGETKTHTERWTLTKI